MMNKGSMIRLFAEMDGEVIDNIQIYFIFDHSIFHHIVEMHAVWVNKHFQRMGVATKLIETASTFSKMRNIEIMTVWGDGSNALAINLYHKIGFTEYGWLTNGIKKNKQYSEYVLLKRELIWPVIFHFDLVINCQS